MLLSVMRRKIILDAKFHLTIVDITNISIFHNRLLSFRNELVPMNDSVTETTDTLSKTFKLIVLVTLDVIEPRLQNITSCSNSLGAFKPIQGSRTRPIDIELLQLDSPGSKQVSYRHIQEMERPILFPRHSNSSFLAVLITWYVIEPCLQHITLCSNCPICFELKQLEYHHIEYIWFVRTLNERHCLKLFHYTRNNMPYIK